MQEKKKKLPSFLNIIVCFYEKRTFESLFYSYMVSISLVVVSLFVLIGI